MKSPTPRNEDADREHTGGVGADEVVLELLEEVVGDGDLGEVAKTGVDTVDNLVLYEFAEELIRIGALTHTLVRGPKNGVAKNVGEYFG